MLHCFQYTRRGMLKAHASERDHTMHTNESTVDRVIRVVLAAVAVVVALLVGAGSVLGIILFIVAAILLVTAAVGFCPIYRILGVRTNRSS